MTDFPKLIVLLLTFSNTEVRTVYALRTIDAIQQNLNYPNFTWYVAEAGDNDKNYNRIVDAIGKDNVAGTHFGSTSPGESWNRGIKGCYEHADVYLRMEDDWILKESTDFRPWMKMLTWHEDMGMIRLGYLHVPADLEAIGIDGIHYLRMKKSTQFAYGGHPALIHKRFHETYGYNSETLDPGKIEIDLDSRFRETPGPESLRPAEIGGWGIFNHIGEVKGY